MRPVAIALALLLLPLTTLQAAPNEPYDECNELSSNKRCHDMPVSPVNGVGATKRYFVWLEGLRCDFLKDTECAGEPNDDHATPTTPDNRVPGSVKYPYNTVVGVMYEDTNGLGGLQRLGKRLPDNKYYPPDRMVLI